MSEKHKFDAVMQRDKAADGRFVYAVLSTGIYCRPSCPSRKPARDGVRFYPLPEAAEQAGFRPCKRCRPNLAAAMDPQIAAVRRGCVAIDGHLDDGAEGPPRLEEIASAAGLSPWHLQRVFKRLVGVSPREYADARRLVRLKQGLKDPGGNGGVSGAVYQAGYGSSSRVYERAAAELGMTPATYAKGGRGADIAFALSESRLGWLLVAATLRGVCMVSLGDDASALTEALYAEYPAARIRRDDDGLQPLIGTCLAHLDGREPNPELPLDVRATAFQWQVWQALRAIPPGQTQSYRELAASLGRPEAARAVARACAENPVALTIPCHRAIRSDGSLAGYRWGTERKRALIEMEQAAKRRWR